MNKKQVGFAVCGSFCTYWSVMEPLSELIKLYDVIPVISEAVDRTDTRFGRAEDYRAKLAEVCGRAPIASVKEAEPIGPKKLLDLLIIAPCTGNTLAKIACGITDGAVPMAAKAHLRNGRPLLLAVATNDGLGANAKNIGSLLERKNVYFVPFRQDGPKEKPTSLQSDFSLLPEAARAALEGVQLEPVLR